jgi:tetratricopeptide (TPR) repeat protein
VIITGTGTEELTEVERSQLDRKELARGAWGEGRPDDALLILNTVLEEAMTPRVAAECYVTQAAFLAEKGEFQDSLAALRLAAPYVDSARLRVQASFFLQRGRINRKLNNLNNAITDYTGVAICAEASDSEDLLGKSFLNLSDLYVMIGKDLVTARAYLNKAVAIFRRIGSDDLCQAYDTLANLELAEGNVTEATEAIRKGFELIGDHESWRDTLNETRDKIRGKLLQLTGINRVEDLDSLKVLLVKRALIETGGNLSHAGEKIGLTYKGVDYIIQQNPELERLRSERKSRLKSVIKKS